MKFLVLITFVVICIFHIKCYKILGVFPMPMYSHYKLASTLLKELANRGHEITVINPYPQSRPLKNYRDISIEEIVKPVNEHKKKLFSLENQNEFNCIRFLTNMGLTMTTETLQHKNVQDLLNNSNETFDLVIVAQFMNEAHMAIAQHFNAPLILMASMPFFSWTNFFLANPSSPSYVPNLLGKFSSNMNFWQRLQNSFFNVVAIAYHQFILLPKHKSLVKTYIPSKPDLEKSLYNVSLSLVNIHESIYYPIPVSSNVIKIGGLHMHPSPNVKNLPDDIKEFLDNSSSGVVVFSMGSNLKTSDLPSDKVEEILKAFSQLKQRVIWKWEDTELPNCPSNVKLIKWIPQQDILAHHNVHAFISHGGLLSTIESVYHGIPILGIPVFTDQKMNIATSVNKGYALMIPMQKISERTFLNALYEILNNPKYRNKAQELSKILRDQPLKPLDLGVYWIEYVIRHKGAPHLRPVALNLYWFQRSLLDITVFFFLFFFFIIILNFKLYQIIYTFTFKTNIKKKRN